MKKIILPVVLMAAMLCGGKASAQTVPNWYNFQGVTEQKSAEIEVTFQVCNDGNEVVYEETATILTNANGAFTHKLGTGKATKGDWMFGIDWSASEYTLVTSINGEKVSEAAFGAVPYATVAENLLGFNLDEYTELAINVKNLNAVAADVTELQDQMEYVSSDLQGVQEKLRDMAKVNDVIELQDQMEIVSSDLQGVQEKLRDMAKVNDVIELQDQMEYVTSDVQGIQEKLRNMAKANDVLELQDAMEQVTSDVQGVQETLRMKASVADVAELQEEVTALQDVTDDIAGIQETLRGKANVADVAELQDAMEYVSSDVQGVQETLRGKANVADVTELQDQMEIVSSDVQGIQESLRGKASVDEVESLAEGLDYTQTDVMNLVDANTENKAKIAKLMEIIEDLQARIAALEAK